MSKINISKIRSILYKSAKLLGDMDAVRKGRIKERLYNRLKGKLLNRTFRNK